MIKTQNIKLYKNSSIDLNFTITDDNDNIIDLTGMTGVIKVFLDIPGQDETFNINKALTIAEPTHGTCSVSLVDSETDINVAVYKYILEFNDASNNFIYTYGSFQVVGDDTERIEEIKRKYGLTYDYYTLRSAMNWAQTQIKNNAFEDVKLIYSSGKTEFKVCNYVMDSNFDGVVDADDINIYQYQENSPYTVEDLNSNVSGVTFNHPNGYTIITLDATYPESTYKLAIEFSRGDDTYSNLIENINLIEELYTIYHLFDILEVNQLQRGLPDRTINGVTISFDRQGIEDYKKTLKQKIDTTRLKIIPFEACTDNMNGGGIKKSVLISKKY